MRVWAHSKRCRAVEANMSQVTAGLNVFVNRRNGSCVILNFCVHAKTGFRVACGPLQRITRQQMEVDGLGIIQRNLEEFQSRAYDGPSEYECLPASERKRVDRTHARLTVYPVGSRELRINLMKPHGQRGGSIGGPKGAQLYTLPGSSAEFYRAILAVAGIGRLSEDVPNDESKESRPM
jgi:hypothetical protein